MLMDVLKRSIPFAMTLVLGTGLGSIFGVFVPTKNSEPARFASRSYSYGSGSGYRSHRNRTPDGVGPGTSDSTFAILYQPNRRYTAEALKNKTQGVVTLLVEFGADGQARVLDRLTTLPDGLTEEAERIVEHTKFNPETVNGEPASITKEMNYYFSLTDRAMVGL